MSDEQDSQNDDFATAPEAGVEDSNPAPAADQKPSGGLKFLTVLMLLAAVSLFVLPFVWGLADKKEIKPDPSVLNDLLTWLGDMHVLVLHIPIGIFTYVLAMESFSLLSFRKFKPKLAGALLLTSLSAIVAVVFGYFLFLQGDRGSAPLNFDWENNRMGMHMWLSTFFAFFVILSYISKLRAQHYEKWSPFYPFFMILAAASMTIGAHMGGEMVHTDKDLVGDGMKIFKGEPLAVAAEDIATIPSVEEIPAEERLVYAQVVQPILQGKCWECHADADLNPLGKKKIKGGLVMTSVADLLKGGKGGDDFPVLVPGDAEASEMMVRVHLDVDDDEFMPTGKEDEPEMQLTDGEKRILEWWINTGPIDEAGDKPLAEAEGFETILADVEAFKSVREAAPAIDVEKEEAAEAKAKTDEKPKKSARDLIQEAKAPIDETLPGALTFSSKDSEELFFTAVSQGKKFDDARLATLKPVAESIVDLDLKKTSVSDEGMKSVATMLNLRKLMLNETPISDAGVKAIAVLPNLESLSLFGTNITDEGVKALAKTSSLKNVYLSGTKATQAGVDELRKNLPEAKIEFMPPPAPKPAPAPKKEEPKKEAPKPAPEPKKEEPKPAPAQPEEKKAAPAEKPAGEKPEAKKAEAPKPAPKVEAPKPAPAPKEEKPAPKVEEAKPKAEAPKSEAKPAPAKPAPAPKVEKPAPAPKPEAPKAAPTPAPKTAEPVPAPKKEEPKKAEPQPTPAPKPETPAPAKKQEVKPAEVPAKEEAKAAPKEAKPTPAPAPAPAPKPVEEKKEAPAPARAEPAQAPADAKEPAASEKPAAEKTPEERAKEAIEKLREAAKPAN
ncbi:c-type cytochrome domain-containing protein [Roseibacillus persicicus]|uniref:Cytochrome C Planctomycete-type domain-containing protein n=1 Tax=Roseibacillus persicicus TaxID=454148 RepID=A0A918TSQ8_9BACT|nr:c-type cytochrome domain-containing protein [Roseibacillus persicicus]GHC59544.1 hypothetical protein GCM10007100_28430 [Roseibacillus persicicus]